jgi:hypothetical protein
VVWPTTTSATPTRAGNASVIRQVVVVKLRPLNEVTRRAASTAVTPAPRAQVETLTVGEQHTERAYVSLVREPYEAVRGRISAARRRVLVDLRVKVEAAGQVVLIVSPLDRPVPDGSSLAGGILGHHFGPLALRARVS